MAAKELGDIQIAHDLAIAYATLNIAQQKSADMEAFYHEYDKAYEHFIILICKKDSEIQPVPLQL